MNFKKKRGGGHVIQCLEADKYCTSKKIHLFWWVWQEAQWEESVPENVVSKMEFNPISSLKNVISIWSLEMQDAHERYLFKEHNNQVKC